MLKLDIYKVYHILKLDSLNSLTEFKLTEGM